MQAIVVRIQGKFWDSQVAEGLLYLFGRSGDIRVFHWDRFVSEFKESDEFKTELQWALCRNDLLYGLRFQLGYPSAEIWQVIQRKFLRLSESPIDADLNTLERYSLTHLDNTFPFPHRDSAAHRGRFYVAGQRGLFSALRIKGGSKQHLSQPIRLTDVPAFTVRPSKDSIALAGGDEGLFEFMIPRKFPDHAPDFHSNALVSQNCVDCSWVFQNLYGSSFTGPGYLAPSTKERERRQKRHAVQTASDLVTEDAIFHERGYSWGTNDLLCQVKGNTVRIVRYNPRSQSRGAVLQDLGTIDMEGWKGDVVSGRVAVFGIVIECDEAMVIKPSVGSVMTLRGEPVRWRIFPGAGRYENHLHVIYEDRLEILSFTHDYFVNQSEKLVGYRHLPSTAVQGALS